MLVRRSNYREADRIIQFLTREYGLVSAVARGVRKGKSKLTGSLQLNSIIEITTIGAPSKDLVTLRSARIAHHFEKLSSSYSQSLIAQEMISFAAKQSVEGKGDSALFDAVVSGLQLLEADKPHAAELFFYTKSLLERGSLPNLRFDSEGVLLDKDNLYRLDFGEGVFVVSESGDFTVNGLKLLRVIATQEASFYTLILGVNEAAADINEQMKKFAQFHA